MLKEEVGNTQVFKPRFLFLQLKGPWAKGISPAINPSPILFWVGRQFFLFQKKGGGKFPVEIFWGKRVSPPKTPRLWFVSRTEPPGGSSSIKNFFSPGGAKILGGFGEKNLFPSIIISWGASLSNCGGPNLIFFSPQKKTGGFPPLFFPGRKIFFFINHQKRGAPNFFFFFPPKRKRGGALL